MTIESIRPRCVSVKVGSHYSGLSRSQLYEAMKRGELKFLKMGKLRRLELDELDRYIDAKSAA